ncbi:2,5-diamino-6-(ribosylamino)-4(3H)-pyrimidinone 5'-phosphate reductase [Ptychographa xylographoides]|nr:2,5-diamino-6-(ribosylamino)-4(3H)-pyrimidinone 5'-phosphate reductase [Ptychographa xylographoides]
MPPGRKRAAQADTIEAESFSVVDDYNRQPVRQDPLIQPEAPAYGPEMDPEMSTAPLDEADEANAGELPLPRKSIRDLLNPPPHLAETRWRLFEVREQIELKVEEFERYWPYIDNVWVRQHRAGTDRSGRVTTDYYACRLQRPTYMPRKSEVAKLDGKPLRKKQTREGGTCQMRIKTVRTEGACPKYTITKVGDHEHTHDLDHMDRIKRNTIVMEIARAEVMKGFMPASVFTIMSEDEDKLAAAGARYLNRNDVRNASQAWRKTHGDQLAVHPGYKYDHGNGIVQDPDTAKPPGPPLTTTNGAHPTPVLDPALTSPPPTIDSLRLPPDTLYFPFTARAFLTPYLPSSPTTTLIPPADTLTPPPLPHITLTYATSLDSFLALGPNTPTPLSSPASKAMTHYLRSRHAAILIGVGTALADNPTLNCRLHGAGGYGGVGWDAQPRPIIIDPAARWVLTPQSRILQAVAQGRAKAPWIIIAPGTAMDPARLELLRFYGGKYLGLPADITHSGHNGSHNGSVNISLGSNMMTHTSAGPGPPAAAYGTYPYVPPPPQTHIAPPPPRLSWEAIFRALAAEGISSVMVEGGATVVNELLLPRYRHLLSSVAITVAPTYLGAGVGTGADRVRVCPSRAGAGNGGGGPVCRFREVRWEACGEDVVMCGRLGRGGGGGAGEVGVDSSVGVGREEGERVVGGQGLGEGREESETVVDDKERRDAAAVALENAARFTL